MDVHVFQKLHPTLCMLYMIYTRQYTLVKEHHGWEFLFMDFIERKSSAFWGRKYNIQIVIKILNNNSWNCPPYMCHTVCPSASCCDKLLKTTKKLFLLHPSVLSRLPFDHCFLTVWPDIVVIVGNIKKIGSPVSAATKKNISHLHCNCQENDIFCHQFPVWNSVPVTGSPSVSLL